MTCVSSVFVCPVCLFVCVCVCVCPCVYDNYVLSEVVHLLVGVCCVFYFCVFVCCMSCVSSVLVCPVCPLCVLRVCVSVCMCVCVCLSVTVCLCMYPEYGFWLMTGCGRG